KSRRVRFFLLSPFFAGLLTFLGSGLLVLLALMTLDLPGIRLPWRKPPAAAALLFAALLFVPGLARAEDPPDVPASDVLDQLRQALTEKPDCFPAPCAGEPAFAPARR